MGQSFTSSVSSKHDVRISFDREAIDPDPPAADVTQPNPYAPPQTSLAHTSAPLFHHRISSRSWRTYVVMLLPVYMTGASVWLVLTQQIGTIRDLLIPLGISAAFWISFLIAIIRPRVHEFRVDRQTVFWQRPWPNATEQSVPTSQIERVEYAGDDLVITLVNGQQFHPAASTHGGNCQAIVEAVEQAVRMEEPTITTERQEDSFWISLGRRVGRLLATWKRRGRRRAAG